MPGKKQNPGNDLSLFSPPAIKPEDVINTVVDLADSSNYPFFQTPNGVFVNADCKAVLNFLPENSIDVIITDPPYLPVGEKFMKDKKEIYGDENSIFEIEDKLWDVLKQDSWVVIYWSIKNLPKIFTFKKFIYKWLIIGLFPSTVSKSVIGDRKYLPIFVFAKGEPKVVYRTSDVIPVGEIPLIQDKIKTPDFKPTVTTSFLLQMFVRKHHLILDPFCGFGGIPIACETFGFKWIGIEIDNDRYKKAKEFFIKSLNAKILKEK